MPADALSAFYPPQHFFVLVRGVVVENDVEFLLLRHLAFSTFRHGLLDPLQKAPALPDVGAADTIHQPRCTRRYVQCREQRSRPMTLVVVGHRTAASLLDRQARLRPVQSLHRALFVDAEHHCVLRRIQIQPHHVVQFLQQIVGRCDLEGTDQVWFHGPTMRLPHTVNNAVRRPHRTGHRACRQCVASFGVVWPTNVVASIIRARSFACRLESLPP